MNKVGWLEEKGVRLPSGVRYEEMVEELTENVTRSKMEELLERLPEE